MDAERKRKAFQRGIELFNQRRFFECHEVLEAIWLEETPEEKPFYQGLIQAAAGFHQLFEKKNPPGALSLLRAGAGKLRRYPSAHHGIDLARLLGGLAPWLDCLERGQPTDDLSPPALHLPR